jgi:predicted metalloprotease with PDZ domain
MLLLLLLGAPVAAWSVTRALPMIPGPVVVTYRVSLPDPSSRTLHVEGTVEGLTGRSFPLALALEGPLGEGRGDRFLMLRATEVDGEPLEVDRPEPGRWSVETRGRDFRFSYDVHLTVVDPYSPHLRDLLPVIQEDHARLIGYAYLILPGVEIQGPIPVDYALPEGWVLHSAWAAGPTRMLVPEREDLPNAVSALGRFHSVRGDLDGIDLQLVSAQGPPASVDAFFERIREICRWQVSLFGSIPRDRYLFVCDRNPVRSAGCFDYYGLHFASSMILLLDGDLAEAGFPALRLVAHEFFHNWNGEAIRPVDLSLNWFTEGVTQYYALRTLDDLGYLGGKGLSAEVARIYRQDYLQNPLAGKVSLEEAGQKVLGPKHETELLYDGGLVLAHLIDREIRAATGSRRCLDDVLRDLYRRGDAGHTLLDRPLLLESLRVAGGIDFQARYEAWVRTPSILPPPEGSLSAEAYGSTR